MDLTPDNSTNNISSLPHPDTSLLWIFDFVAYWELMVSLIGTPMNLFVIFIWATLTSRSSNRRFSTQSKNRWFILSMTCGDLLFASIHAPLMYGWYSGVIDPWTDAFCYITYGSTHLSATVSSLSLLLLNVDKFIYLHWPLHYHSIMTTKRALALTTGAVSLGIIWMMVFLFGPFLKRDSECNWEAQHTEFYVSFLVFFFLMPILLSVATSLYIATVAVRASIREAASQAAYGNQNNGNFVEYPTPKQSTADDSDLRLWTKQSTVEFGAGSSPQSNGHRLTINSTGSGSVKPWRTITFVFTTTIWSTITYFPYRLSFIVFTVTKRMVMSWHYPLFALMILYAAGNPFITILTQPPYRKRALDIFESVRTAIKRLFGRDDIPIRRK